MLSALSVPFKPGADHDARRDFLHGIRGCVEVRNSFPAVHQLNFLNFMHALLHGLITTIARISLRSIK